MLRLESKTKAPGREKCLLFDASDDEAAAQTNKDSPRLQQAWLVRVRDSVLGETGASQGELDLV